MYRKFLKRLFDFIVSLLSLVLLSPIFLILIIVGAAVMKGNPFFTQIRPGKIDRKTGKEKLFRIIKFRTMTNEKDSEGNLLPDGERLIGYGKFLRKTSLDEIPELIDVLLGKMTLVGPRPQLVRDMVFMTDKQRKRHTVLPGLTGLAQVNGRNNITWEKKFELDLEYIENITFLGDVKIILKTFGTVLKRENIDREGTHSDVDFGDYLLESGRISQGDYSLKQEEAKELMKV